MRLLFAFLLCCAVTAGWSQSHHPELPFEHLNIPGTINSSQVYDLIQDQHGLLWVAGNGLYRYDGYKFNLYRNISDSISIGGQEIHCLFNDTFSNKLLLGTHSNGIVSYDYTSQVFTVLPSKHGIPVISHIAQTSDGTPWGSSFTNGLFYLERDTLVKFRTHKVMFNNNACIAAAGNILLVGGDRIVYLLRNREIVDSINIQAPGVQPSAAVRVTALTADRAGKVWIGTEQQGVFVYDTLSKTVVKHFSPASPPFHNRINKILEDKNGRVWILTKGEGLVVYSPSTGNYIHVVRNPLNERSLSGDNCTAVIQDQTGIVWIGATGDLNKYDPSKIKFRHIYNNPFAITSLNDNMVRGIYETADKKLWVGTEGGVVHIFDEQRLSVKKIELKLAGKKRIVPLYFQEIPGKTLLVASTEGMLQYNRATDNVSYYKPLEQRTKGHQVRQVILYKHSLFYISQGGYLWSYNLKTGKEKVYNHRDDPSSVKNATILYVDHANRLWAGVRDGISVYDSLTDSFVRFDFERNTARPAGTYFMILSLQEYAGKLWIGTFNDGLWTLDLSNLRNPAIIHVSKNREFHNMTVYSTLPDSEGNLWMSTNGGITEYNPATDKYVDFTVTEGLQQDEFNRLAYTLCANGEIVLGGINGLNIFNPKNISITEDDYTPKFLSVAVYDEDTNSDLLLPIDSAEETTLSHTHNHFDFSFFIANFRNPKRFEVFYTLKGYNTDWIKAEGNTLRYSNLKPGVYDMLVKTVSISGKEKTASFKFEILPPFWQTWWFLGVSTLAACLGVVAIIQGSLYRSMRDKERLEQLLSIRTQEIEKSREELANLNQKKDLIFSILSHDLRSPLTTLKGFLSILIDDNDLSKEDIKKHASNIRNSVTSSLDLIDNTLFWSLSQTGNIAYTPTTFLLNDMLQKIGGLYHLIVEKKRITFSIEINETITLYADENMTYVTLRNLVSNALKFTPPGNAVKIRAYTKNQCGIVIVEDEGIGMSQPYLAKLFTEEQLPLTKGTHDEKGTGIGLILCRKFMHMNKGKLSVKSTEGKGTEFTVELPLA